MQAIRDATAEDLEAVDGIGGEKAPVIVAELLEVAPVVDKLVWAGVNMTQHAGDTTAADTVAFGAEDGTEPGTLPLAGLTVVVTGAISGVLAEHSRTEMNELIARVSGKSSSSVSASTHLVVAGEKAGSKLDKARSLRIEVLTPEEFAQRLAAVLG
jgi:DNA ligase (NAD+)